MLKQLFKLSIFILFIESASGATFVISDGLLLGANNVNVDGIFYDVNFVDGSCVSLYNNCDDQADFLFVDNDAASAASIALLDQVFIGIYDDEPWLTRGCTNDRCRVRTAFGLLGPQDDQVNAHAAVNSRQGAVLGDTTTSGSLDIFEDTTTMDNRTMAVWTLSEVPIPAAAWLFGSAIIGLVDLGTPLKYLG